MNTNNRNSIFPFRRGGGKKRGKPAGGARRQGGPGNGRRVPNSAGELLGLLQPTTKSLAQVLAGNTRASGQIVHARSILEQAERMVDERAVDRLPPIQREEFFEQMARLKLTLADADREAEGAEPVVVAPAAAPMSMDRLRAMAISMAAGSTPSSSVAAAAEPEPAPEPVSEPVAAPMTVTSADEQPAVKTARPKRGDTLRLKTLRHDPADADDGERRPSPVR